MLLVEMLSLEIAHITHVLQRSDDKYHAHTFYRTTETQVGNSLHQLETALTRFQCFNTSSKSYLCVHPDFTYPMTKHMIPELQAHVGVPSNCG
jgi:hypothetical protein